MRKLKDFITNFFKQYRHIWILSYFAIYLVWFNYLEKMVTTHFHVIHVPIDDYIPFCEYFVIPYIMWFPFQAWLFFLSYRLFIQTDNIYVHIISATIIYVLHFVNGCILLIHRQTCFRAYMFIIHSVYILRLWKARSLRIRKQSAFYLLYYVPAL